MWDTVSWMRMALCSPRRDLEGYSIKACEGFKCCGKEVGWGEAPAAAPEETSLRNISQDISPAVGGTLYWPKVKLVVASIKPFHWCISPHAFTWLHVRAVWVGRHSRQPKNQRLGRAGISDSEVLSFQHCCELRAMTGVTNPVSEVQLLWLYKQKLCRRFLRLHSPCSHLPPQRVLLALQVSEASAREVQA